MGGAISAGVLNNGNGCATMVNVAETNALQNWQKASVANWQTVYFPDGKIAARVDPQRGLLEIQRRGQRHVFDLADMGNSTD